MQLFVDIGNTAISYGIVPSPPVPGTKKGARHLNITYGSCLYDDVPKFTLKWCASGDKLTNAAIISSVNPKETLNFKKHLKNFTFLMVEKDIPIRFAHQYEKIAKLGQDRKVNIYGALKLYKTPVLIFDFGTALKVDYISKKGVFEGGMIIPGPEIAFQSLIERAVLLPKHSPLPTKSASFLGQNTIDCMKSGILEGYGAMTEGLIQKFKKKYGKNLFVLGTGGFVSHLKPYAKGFDKIDRYHTVKSMRLLFLNTCSHQDFY